MKNQTRCECRKAFTLLELLVVIAIIGLLAAILFPVFARVRENGRRASCQSNFKQIGLGFVQYIQDYDETMPGAFVNNTNDRWMDYLQSYVKSYEIFRCPSDSSSNRPAYHTDYSSYTVNSCGWGETNSNGNTGPFSNYGANLILRNSSITNPSTTFLALDTDSTVAGHQYRIDTKWCDRTNGTMTDALGFNNVQAGPPRSITNGKFSIIERHLDTTDVLYCDGHVKAYNLDYIMTSTGVKATYFTIKADPN